MADQDIQNSHSEEMNRYEHRRKNVGAKAVVLYGYDSDTDSYYPIKASDAGDGSFGVQTIGGLISVAFDEIVFTNPNGNSPPQYQTGTVKKSTSTVGSLALTYDGDGTLTSVKFTAS